MSRLRLALLLGSVPLLLAPAAAAEEPAPAKPAPATAALPDAATADVAPADPAKPPAFVAESPAPSARGTLALAGAGVFAVWYGAAVGESFLWPDAPEAKKLRLPVVGPWLTLAHAGCASGEANCSDFLAVARAVLAGITGVAQVGGLAALAEAAFLPTASGERALPPKRAVHVQSVTLTAGDSGIGLGLSGAF